MEDSFWHRISAMSPKPHGGCSTIRLSKPSKHGRTAARSVSWIR